MFCSKCGIKLCVEDNFCPNCGNPVSINALANDDNVKIRLSPLKANSIFHGKQEANIVINDVVVWEGLVGDTIDLKCNGPTNICVHYFMSAAHYGGTCEGVIDPSKSKKYKVEARLGFLSTSLTIMQVDVFD